MIKNNRAAESAENPSQDQSLKDALGVKQGRANFPLINEKHKTEEPAEKTSERTEPLPELQQINRPLPDNLIGMIKNSFGNVRKKECRKQRIEQGVVHVFPGTIRS